MPAPAAGNGLRKLLPMAIWKILAILSRLEPARSAELTIYLD